MKYEDFDFCNIATKVIAQKKIYRDSVDELFTNTVVLNVTAVEGDMFEILISPNTCLKLSITELHKAIQNCVDAFVGDKI